MAISSRARGLVLVQAGAILILVIAALGWQAIERSTTCPTTAGVATLSYQGEVKCVRRGLFAPATIIKLQATAAAPQAQLRLEVPSADAHELQLMTQGTNGNSTFVLNHADNPKSIYTSEWAGAAWTLVNQRSLKIVLPAKSAPLLVNARDPEGLVEVEVLSAITLPAGDYKVSAVSTINSRADSSWLAYGLSALVVGISLSFFWRKRTTASGSDTWLDLWVITSVGFIVSLYGGVPFGAAAGWIDAGDDMSYFHWAYNLGYLWNPYLDHALIASWTSTSNVHSWGTGLFLGLPMSLVRLMRGNGLPPQIVIFYLCAATTSLLLGWAGVVIYYFAFRRLLSSRLATLCALATMLATSMLKWTYMRSVFSHTSEAFCLALMTYLLIVAYQVPRLKKTYLAAYFLSGIMLAQIRREDLLFLFVPIITEWTLGRRRSFGTAIAAVLCAVTAVLILKGTNLFIHNRGFWAKDSVAHMWHFNEVATYFSKNAYEMVFGSNFGLLSWWNIPAWLSVLALLTQRRQRVLSSALALLAAGYVCAFIVYEYPNGVEWQNRFMLKLNPIIFLGAGLFLERVRVGWQRGLFGTLVVATMAFEFSLYRGQLPSGLSFYSDFVTDGQIFTGRARNLEQAAFFFPLLAGAALTCLFGGLAVKLNLSQGRLFRRN